MAVLAGCCCGPKPPKPADPISNPTNSPGSSASDIDGSQDYRAQAAGAGVFVVTLPHGTEATRISAITIWANTTGLEGIRKGNTITCDTIALVTDPPAHTIVVNDMFRSVLNGDSAYVTTGTATANGDVFEFTDDGSERFNQLRSTVSRGQVWIRLKNNQAQPKVPVVNSAKVLISLR